MACWHLVREINPDQVRESLAAVPPQALLGALLATVLGLSLIHIFSLPETICAGSLLSMFATVMKRGSSLVISFVRASLFPLQTASNKGLRFHALEMCIRDRRRTVVTILALGCSGILFLAVANIANNITAENYARMLMPKMCIRDSSIPLPQTTFCLLLNRVRNRPKK